MAKKKSITQNFIYNAFLNATQILFPLITYPYVARVLLPEGSGKVTLATSLVGYFIMFQELGIPKYGIRKCAIVRDDKEKLSKTVQELFIIQLLTTAITVVAYIVCVCTVPQLRSEKTLYLVVGSSIIFHAIGFGWLYRALEEYRYIAVRSIVFKIISIVAMFILVHKKEDYVLYGAISVFASAASHLCNFWRARKIISFRPMRSYDIKQHLKPILVFFAMACAVSIYSHIDTIMLGFMVGESAVGYYNAATKVKSILVSLMISLSVVLLPRASYYLKEGKTEKFWMIARKSLNFSALFGIPMVIYFILFSDTAVMFLAGPMYEPAVIAMQIIMPCLLLIGFSYPMGIQILVPMNKEKIVLYSEIAGAVVNVIANAILILCFGVKGAALGTVLAEGSVLLVQYAYMKKIKAKIFISIQWWKILVATAVGVCLSIWVKLLHIGEFWELALSAICFFGSYGLILLITKETMVGELVAIMIKRLKSALEK